MANNNNTKNLNVPPLRFPEFKGEWEKCKLEECVVFLDGKRKPIKSSERVSEQRLYPYYGASGIIDYIDDYIFDGKFILLSEDGANILDRNYRVAFIAEGKIWVNNHAHVLQSNNNIDINFITEKLESLDYSIYNTGSTMPKLNKEVCRNIPLWLPPTEEQVKIGTLLSLLNERITTQIKIIEKYESLIKGLNEKLLINKKEYTTYRLSDICEIRSGYSGTQLTGTQGLMVSRIETISKHCINLDKVGYVKPFNSSDEFKLHIGDILFSNINSVQYIGNTAFVDREYNLYHGMNLLRLIPHKTVEPFYIFLLLNTITYKSYFQSICNKAISQASINQTELGKTVIHIPNLLYQKQICQIYNSLYNKKNVEKLYLQALKQQKRYLLRQMFI